MVEGLIGKKVGISQSFDEQGNVVPVTVIQAGPCTVFQKKTKKKDGYFSLQLGFIEEKGIKKPSRPLVGHCQKAGVPPQRIFREFRFNEQANVKEGDQFFVDIFRVGEKVHITGRSKGKGFAGVVKRWGFHGGKDSHGSMFHRAPGSIGASAFPSRETDKENNLLVVKGAVPGAKGGYLLIRKAKFESMAGEGIPKPSEEKKSEEKKQEEKKKE